MGILRYFMIFLVFTLTFVSCSGGSKKSRKQTPIPISEAQPKEKPAEEQPIENPELTVTIQQRGVAECSGNIKPDSETIKIIPGDDIQIELEPSKNCMGRIYEDKKILGESPRDNPSFTFQISNIQKDRTLIVEWMDRVFTESESSAPLRSISPSCIENGLTCQLKQHVKGGLTYPNLTCPQENHCILTRSNFNILVSIFSDEGCSGVVTEFQFSKFELPVIEHEIEHDITSVCIKVTSESPFPKNINLPLQVAFYRLSNHDSEHMLDAYSEETHLATISHGSFSLNNDGSFMAAEPIEISSGPLSITFKKPKKALLNADTPHVTLCESTIEGPCFVIQNDLNILSEEMGDQFTLGFVPEDTRLIVFDQPEFTGKEQCLTPGLYINHKSLNAPQSLRLLLNVKNCPNPTPDTDRINELQSQIQNDQNQIRVYQAEINGLRGQTSPLQAQIRNLQNQNASWQNTIRLFQDRLNRLPFKAIPPGPKYASTINEAQNSVNQNNRTIQSARARINTINTQIRNKQAQIQKLTQRIQQAQSNLTLAQNPQPNIIKP